MMNFLKKNVMGIAVCVLIAALATCLGKLTLGSFSLDIIGAPVFAILIGMIISLAFPSLAANEKTKDGIRFTSKKILQCSVIILGFTLNLKVIAQVGAKSLPVILCTISTSLIIAYLMRKVLKLDSNTACLVGVGSSICGGSAIAATAPVIDADDEEVARAISVIFFFNVIAALIFPTIGHAIGLGSEGFAVFAGTAVNDTSSVTATASTAEGIYGVNGILSAAVTVKLTRTLAIIPITLGLAIIRARKAGKSEATYSFKKVFPFFILFFIAASLITTVIGLLPESGFTGFYGNHFLVWAKWLAKFFIAMAMCAIGLNTNLLDLVKKSKKALLLGLCCWIGISLVSLGIQYMTGIYGSNL